MEHYAGIDVSLESASVCVVDASGRIVSEAKVASEPDVLIRWFGNLGVEVSRRLADRSSSDPIRWRPRADPGQKQDTDDRITLERD